VTGSWLLSAYAMQDDRSPAVHLRRVEEEKRRSPGGGSHSALEFIPCVSGRRNCWCLCLAALLLTSWWKVPGGASNPCSTLSLHLQDREFFFGLTSQGTLLVYNKGSIKGVVRQLPLVLPCRGVSCEDDSTGMEPATQNPTGDFEGSLDHVLVSGTRYRVYIPTE